MSRPVAGTYGRAMTNPIEARLRAAAFAMAFFATGGLAVVADEPPCRACQPNSATVVFLAGARGEIPACGNCGPRVVVDVGPARPTGETPACGNCRPNRVALTDPESGGCSICVPH